MIVYDKSISCSAADIGGKGVGLCKLISYGFSVPDFFVVTAGTDINDKYFPAELDGFAAYLNCDLFAVRSSSVDEDGADGSYAGQYETLLNVPRQNLAAAVRTVANSFCNNSVGRYTGHFGKSSGKVAVIVQKQLEGEISGVMFTSSPYSEDERIIESVQGAGEKLVGGQVAPRELVFRKSCPPKGVYTFLSEAAERLEDREGRALDIEWTFCDNKLWFLQMRPLTALGDNLPAVPQRDWNLYVYRDFCVFARAVQAQASRACVQQQVFGFSVPIAEGLIVCGREFYSPENDVLCDELWKSLDGDGFFEKFIRQIKHSVEKTRRRVAALKKLDCEELDVNSLLKLFAQEYPYYLKSYVPLMMRPDDYLYNKLVQLVGEDRAEKIAGAAAVVNKKTYYSSERRDFLRSVLSGAASDYLGKYEWECNPLGKVKDTPLKERYYRRAEGITRGLAVKKLKELNALRKRNNRERNRVVEGLSEKERKLFEIISEFVYLRTYTAENSDRYFYYFRTKILTNIGKRLNIAEDELLLMSPDEVAETANGYRLTAREVSKRRSGDTAVISGGESAVYYTGRSYALLKTLLPETTFCDGVVLEGRVACMGEVRGKVRIVNNVSQADDFEEGCVLVTSMTVPEITAALDKASGIITDEGGITCHAAIIAREYGVPCLVGTKYATAILKDGMDVKLDCVNGRVIVDK